jgi:predicted  nucleic acid-binding Zn-ribbon protein
MQPVVSISPDKGTAGTKITVDVGYYNITSAAQPTYVFFDTNKNGKYDSGEPYNGTDKSPGLSLDNVGNGTVTLTVPAGVGYGTYKVYANNTLGQVRYATYTVMEPVMNIGPTSGAAGATVAVEINYFNKTAGAGTTYTFFDSNGNGIWDLGEPKATFTLNNTGGGTATLTVPTVDLGVYKIYTKNDVQSVYKTFTVTSTEVSLLEEIKNMVIAIEGKLDNSTWGLQAIKNAVGEVLSYLTSTINPKLDVINTTVTTIQGILNNADYGLAAIKSYLTDTIYYNIDELEPLLKNADYGLEAIKTAIDNVHSEVTNSTYGLAAIKNYVSVINWTDITAIKTAVQTDIPATLELIKAKTDTINWTKITALTTAVADVEAKLDALPAWGNLVTKNWTDLTAYIDSAKADIIAAMPTLDLTPVLEAINSSKAEIIASMPDLTPVASAIDAVEAKLDNETYGLVAIKNAVSGLSVQLSDAVDTITGAVGDAEASILAAISDVEAKLDEALPKLDAIKAVVDAIKLKTDTINWADIAAIKDAVNDIELKLDALTAAQATSGSGSATFTASGSKVIYEGHEVGTVTVSLKTSGVGAGESLVIRYYIDPRDSKVYIEKTVTSGRDTPGWTDTAAAWKVEIVYTRRSGTDMVYWGYSVIYPP